MNLLSQLDSFKNNQRIITYNQSTNDIIGAILRQHNKSEKDYDKLFCFFDKGNVKETAKCIFNYLKNNIKYVIEPDNLQTVKTPAAILATAKSGSDCKNFSLFFAGNLDALRRNTGEKFDLAYRFASYDNSNIPEHVFVVINPNTENEIWCDGVLDFFNEKKQPTYYKDKKIKNMALMALSGINEQSNTYQQPQMNGVLDIATSILDSGVIPGGGAISSALKALTGGLFSGHSDYYYYDLHYGTQKFDLLIAQALIWFEKGKSINQFDFSRIWSDTNTKYPPKRRIDMLLEVYKSTNDSSLIPIINAAVDNGLLPASNKISPISKFFSSGTSKDGKTSGGMNMTIPIVIGAAAVIGFLIFKKK